MTRSKDVRRDPGQALETYPSLKRPPCTLSRLDLLRLPMGSGSGSYRHIEILVAHRLDCPDLTLLSIFVRPV